MTIKLSTGQRILVGLLGVGLFVLALGLGLRKIPETTAVIPAGVIVNRALQIANQQGPGIGGSLTPLTAARGKVTTYGEAYQFLFNQPPPSGTSSPNPIYPVWLVVLQGQFIEHVPASAGGDIPAKDVLHSQMAIILDGDTTEAIETMLVSPAQPLDVSSLPVLALPSGALAATTTPIPTPIFAPPPAQTP